MQYSNKPVWGDSSANLAQDGEYHHDQRRNDGGEHQAIRQDTGGYDQGRESDFIYSNDVKPVYTQPVRAVPDSHYSSSGPHHVRQYSSNSPSSNWSTASPSASWGTTQPEASQQPWLYSSSQASSDRSLLDKAKDYLQGSGSGAASRTADSSAQPTLLDKAKEYLPGTGSTRSTVSWQGSDTSGLQQGSATGGTYQAGTYSRPETDHVPVDYGRNTGNSHFSTAGSEQSAFDGSQGAVSSRGLGYRANQDAEATGRAGANIVGQPESTFKQHSVNTDHDSERDSLAGGSSRFSHIAQRDSPVSNSSHQSKFSATGPDSTYSNEASYGQQGVPGYNGGNRPEQRFSSESSFASSATGIPPPFHPPAYVTQDTPQYQPYTGPTDRQQAVTEQGTQSTPPRDTEGWGIVQSVREYLPGQSAGGAADNVHATEALRPLTQIPAGGSRQADDEVHAKDALQALTQIPADSTAHHDRGGRLDEEGVHARDALEPLTVLPAEGKGIVETVLEYLPGHGTPTAENQHSHQTTVDGSEGAQPGLFEKAKAYIPVIGSSTEFDPASTGRQAQEERLYQESPLPQEPLGQAGQSPSFVERAKGYVPTFGASGTAASGYDARSGQGTSAPHTGLVESIVEKVQEFVHPHHTAQATAETKIPANVPAAHTVTDRATERDIDPSVQGVKLTNYSTFGTDAGHSTPFEAAEAQQAPGVFDRVKQLVGLGPSTETEDSTQRAPSSPIIASQGINAGILGGSGRVDSHAIDDDEEFQDAVESPPESFTTTDTAYGSGASNQEPKKPYVNQSGPPLVDTSDDPDETFGPVKQDRRAQPTSQGAQNNRDTVGFGDEADDHVESDGKHGLRSKVKDRLGNKREHHHEKQRVKADHALEQKMQQKELKTEAVTTPAAPGQATKAPTAGSNLGPGAGAGGVAEGTPADPQGNAQSQDKAASEQPPASDKSKNPKDPHTAVKANENAGGSNIAIGGAAQQKMEETPPKESRGGFFGRLKKPFRRNKS